MKSTIASRSTVPSAGRAIGRVLFTRRRAQLLLLCLMISALTLWLGTNRARMATFQSTIQVGAGAGCPAVNPVTNKIYVANAGSNNVTVINGADHSTATVAVGTFPSAIAINAVTNKIYVANTNSNDVTVIDGADNSTTTVPVGSNPKGLVANSVTNKVYVTNSISNTVTVIDGADNSTATISVGSAPFAVAVNAVTNKVYVGNCGQFCGGSGNGDVTVIDGADNSTAAVTAGTNPQAIVVNPATNRIYVANLGGGDVTVINGADNSTTSVTLVPDANGFAIALNPVTNKIYVLSGQTVRIINGADNTQVTVPLGSLSPLSIAINPMTNKIYVACQSPNNLTVIDGADNSMTTLTTGFSPGAVAVNPVTNKIYVTPSDNTPSMAVIDGADYARVTIPAGSRPVDVALNPVTNKIYVANCGDCVFASSGGTGIGDVTVINGSDNSTATVTAGTNPFAVAVNPVTNKTYVANYGSNNVTVINGADNSTATVTAGTSPIAIAVNPITNKIYVVNNGSATVTIINGADNSTVTISAGTTPFSAATNFLSGTGHYAIAVNQITNRIYVGNKSGANVMVINGADNSTATVAVGSQPAALAVNTATNKVYVANEGSNNVTVIDAADNTTVTVPAGSLPWAVAVNPLTNKIYVGGSFMTVINGQDNTTTTISGGNDVAIGVNPATNKLFVANFSFKPRVINCADNSMQTLNTLQSGPIAVAVNAVTNKSYFVNHQSDNVNVYTEQNVQTIPLTVSITPQAFQPDSPSRTFNFTASSTFSPTAPPVQQIHYQVDTWVNTWMTATPAGSNTQSSATLGPLPDGLHIIYAYATDGRDGATSAPPLFATSGGSPMIGPIQSYIFFINSTAPVGPTIAATAGLSRQQGSPAANSQIASVSDAGGNGNVTVTVTSANPSNGVTISNLVNTAGVITADIVADCNATGATFTLQGSNGTLQATDTLNIAVTANTGPTLTYTSPQATAFDGSLNVTPTTANDNGTITGYAVQSVVPAMTTAPTVAANGVVSITNAQPAGSHTITIRATDNCSAFTDASFTLNVSKASQSIIVGTHAPANATYNTSFTVAATADSGLAVSYSSSGACTNVGPTFTMTSGTGTCTVKYDQAGDNNYNAATQMTESVTAQKVSQTINVAMHAPPNASYNTSFTVAAASDSGLAIAYGSSGACTNAGPVFTMTTGTGTCTVKYDQSGDTNYNAATQVTELVTAQKASQSMNVATHAPANATYNTSFTVAATSDSGLSIAYSSSGVCTNVGPVFTMLSGTGTCSVKYDQAGDTNYNSATQVVDSVTAQKASQTINVATHAPEDATYNTSFTVAGTSASGLTIVYSSSGVCTNVGPTFTMTSGTGTCTVKYDQAGDDNFNSASQVTESVTAQKANQSITVGTHAPVNAAFNTSFIVAATSNSGLTVAYSSSGACTNVGATFTMTSGTGSCTVKYDQAGDDNFNSASQVTESVTAQKANQSITVGTHSPVNAAFSTSFIVAATSNSGLTVAYSSAGACTNVGPNFTMTSGTGSCTVKYDQAGDGNFNSASQATEAATAQTLATTTDVSASPNPSGLGQSVTFKATITSTAGTPTGTVQFKIDGANSGPLVTVSGNGLAQLTSSSLTAGTHTVTADYIGDGNFAASTGALSGGQIVGSEPLVSLSNANYNVNESTGFVTITVNRTGDLSVPVTVDYATDDTGSPSACGTTNGLASARCDFGLTLGTLQFAANETQKTFVIPITQDSYTESSETFAVSLSNLTGTGSAFATPSSSTVTITDGANPPPPNALDDTEVFVRQQYRDFLNRDADPAGLAFWKNNIDNCNTPRGAAGFASVVQCIEFMRINTSAAFFLSIEFQSTGNLVRSFYVAALDRPATNGAPAFAEFERDTQAMQRGVVVGQSNWQQTLNDNRDVFMKEFVMRPEFVGLYPTVDSPSIYVSKLYQHALGRTPTATELQDGVSEFPNGATQASAPAARGRALLRVTQATDFQSRELNRSFVQMEYFGYLRRNPNDAPDADFNGYNFWLNKLNAVGGNYIQAEMVKAFLTSSEYRGRFGP